MSVIDKWLNIHRQNEPPATSATTATNPNTPCCANELHVASDLRHFATNASEQGNVATLSQPVCDNKSEVYQWPNANVADVADVAGGQSREDLGANAKVAYSRRLGLACCECGEPINERLPTTWGGLPCHRECGEAAWHREWSASVN